MARKIIICRNCNKQGEHIAKGMCNNCYKRIGTPLVICKNCGKERNHKAKGMCSNCHRKVFHYDKTKNFNYGRWYNISPELYRNITQKCLVCGFNKMINLHHLDHDRKNNFENNLVGLCPNHHMMIHDYRYSEEVACVLRNLGYNPKVTKL